MSTVHNDSRPVQQHPILLPPELSLADLDLVVEGDGVNLDDLDELFELQDDDTFTAVDGDAPPSEPTLPFADWIAVQASYQRSLGSNAGDWLAGRLDELAEKAREFGSDTPDEFDAAEKEDGVHRDSTIPHFPSAEGTFDAARARARASLAGTRVESHGHWHAVCAELQRSYAGLLDAYIAIRSRVVRAEGRCELLFSGADHDNPLW